MNKLVMKTTEWIVDEIKIPKDNQIQFTVSGITDFLDFRKALNRNETQVIKVQTGKSVTAVYESFNQIIYPLGIEETEDGTMKVTVTLQKEDEALSRLAAVEDAVSKLIKTGLGAL